MGGDFNESLLFKFKLNGRIEKPVEKENIKYGKSISIRNQW